MLQKDIFINFENFSFQIDLIDFLMKNSSIFFLNSKLFFIGSACEEAGDFFLTLPLPIFFTISEIFSFRFFNKFLSNGPLKHIKKNWGSLFSKSDKMWELLQVLGVKFCPWKKKNQNLVPKFCNSYYYYFNNNKNY